MAEHWIELKPHPATRSEVVRTIRARVNRSGATLLITYRLEGDIERIRIPPLSAPVMGHELWRHTCLEAFIKMDGAVAYHEFNFAPSREWAVYALSGYRSGTPLTDASMNPRISVRINASSLELDAIVRLDLLSTLHSQAVLQIGVAAVIKIGEDISYWALRHPADKPDFHDPASFALRCAPPNPKQ